MAKEHIYFDKTELVLVITNEKKVQALNVAFDKISRIQFDKITEHKLFKSVPSEKITIQVRGREKPVEYTKLKEGKFFDGYKTGLAKFAKENKITFADNTAAQ